MKVNIGKGEQFAPAFKAIAANYKIPALVDHEPGDGQGPLALCEFGELQLSLAEKSGRYLPADQCGRTEVLNWLFWQVAGLGSIAGQVGHFLVYAPEKVLYAIKRYGQELAWLYDVLAKRLYGWDFIVGDYSIADMACYP